MTNASDTSQSWGRVREAAPAQAAATHNNVVGRPWFGRPLWEMEPADADVYFGKAVRGTAKGTRLSRAQALDRKSVV